MSSKEIYLDNAAFTPIHPQVRKEVIRGLDILGNPSAYNDAGRRAAKELVQARMTVARFLGAHQDEIVFTASGSESNSLAILGTVYERKGGDEMITTPIEHHSVLESIKLAESQGIRAVFLRVDSQGKVDASEFAKKLSGRTLLVSVMYANNEIGTIEPIAEIGKIVKNFRTRNSQLTTRNSPLFHIDACQATAYLPMNVNAPGVDLLTFNSTKIYGPPGAAVLYVRRGVKLSPLVMGGGQERGLRAGTENLPAILGLAKALTLIDKKEAGPRFAGGFGEASRQAELRDYFLKKLPVILPEAILNGPHSSERLANNISLSIPGLDSENLLLELDKYGIRAGSGSACTARSVEPSHVLRAIGVEGLYLSGVVRFSLGRQTTKKDIEYALKVLPEIVQNLKRRYSVV